MRSRGGCHSVLNRWELGDVWPCLGPFLPGTFQGTLRHNEQEPVGNEVPPQWQQSKHSLPCSSVVRPSWVLQEFTATSLKRRVSSPSPKGLRSRKQSTPSTPVHQQGGEKGTVSGLGHQPVPPETEKKCAWVQMKGDPRPPAAEAAQPGAAAGGGEGEAGSGRGGRMHVPSPWEGMEGGDPASSSLLCALRPCRVSEVRRSALVPRKRSKWTLIKAKNTLYIRPVTRGPRSVHSRPYGGGTLRSLGGVADTMQPLSHFHLPVIICEPRVRPCESGP